MNLFYDNVMVGRRQDGSPIYTKDLREELARLRADSAELARVRGPVELSIIAYARKWHSDGEEPKKERNENGRMVWPVRFKFLAVTPTKLMRDDEPLVSIYDANRAIAQARHIPEGFVLVPVEPTPEMLEAGLFSNPNANRLVYKAMLAAATKGDSHE